MHKRRSGRRKDCIKKWTYLHQDLSITVTTLMLIVKWESKGDRGNIRPRFPKFHTRAMKAEMFTKFGRWNLLYWGTFIQVQQVGICILASWHTVYDYLFRPNAQVIVQVQIWRNLKFIVVFWRWNQKIFAKLAQLPVFDHVYGGKHRNSGWWLTLPKLYLFEITIPSEEWISFGRSLLSA